MAKYNIRERLPSHGVCRTGPRPVVVRRSAECASQQFMSNQTVIILGYLNLPAAYGPAATQIESPELMLGDKTT